MIIETRIDVYLDSATGGSIKVGSFKTDLVSRDNTTKDDFDAVVAKVDKKYGKDGWDSIQFWSIEEAMFEVIGKKIE